MQPSQRQLRAVLAQSSCSKANHRRSALECAMPSYGSNDGYGRQKLGARPSTRLTDIGQKQHDSSRMAALLAEEDIRPQKSAHDPACNIVEVDPSAPPDVQWFQAARAGDGAARGRAESAHRARGAVGTNADAEPATANAIATRSCIARSSNGKGRQCEKGDKSSCDSCGR